MKIQYASMLLIGFFFLAGCTVSGLEMISTQDNQNDLNGLQIEGIPTNIPVINNYETLSVEDRMISYSTPLTLSEVVAFYKQEMPSRNWENNAAATHTDAEMKNSKLTYYTDSQSALISILNQGDSTLVTIFLSDR